MTANHRPIEIGHFERAPRNRRSLLTPMGWLAVAFAGLTIALPFARF